MNTEGMAMNSTQRNAQPPALKTPQPMRSHSGSTTAAGNIQR